MVEDLLFWVIACAFALVSVALTINILMHAWLEYIQVKEGIQVFRNQQFQEEEQDDDFSN